MEVVSQFWGMTREMAPYLLVGFLMAGILSLVVPPSLVERHLGGRGLLPVLKAAILGVPLPLCSCGVIPVAASLRRHGAGRGATTAFLLSTPQTGADGIMAMLSVLGPVFAVVSPIVAFVTGVVGGIMVNLFGGPDAEAEVRLEPCREACCVLSAKRTNPVLQALRHAFVVLPRDIGRAMLAGLAIASLISAFLPADFVRLALGSGIGAMLLMMLMGIPVYVCATASIPIAAAMIAKGASPGAALVFLMTGPATNVATILTLWKLLGRRSAIIYLVSLMGCALAAGIILEHTFQTTGLTPGPVEHAMLPAGVQSAAAVVLLAVLLASLIRRPIATPHPPPESAAAAAGAYTKLAIQGMTCDHCARTVRNALANVPGVQSVDVALGEQCATVYGTDARAGDLRQAVEKAGYKVVGVEEGQTMSGDSTSARERSSA